MITLAWLYIFAGIVFALWSLRSALDVSNTKRFGNTAFWGLLAVSFFLGDYLGDLGNGLLVLALVGIAGFGLLGRGDPPTTSLAEREALSERLGNKLFLPAIIIPVTAFVGTLLYNYTALGESGLFEASRVTLILLGLGVILALIVCLAWLGPIEKRRTIQPAHAELVEASSLTLRQAQGERTWEHVFLSPIDEGRRLMDSIGWAAVLPQMLAALGAVFALAGVGEIIGGLAGAVIPEGNVFVAVAIYAVGMAAFTMVMGNAFAAFPVMAAAIGVPILIQGHGGNAAVIGAIGMLAGFCGTLMTPMAANFNIVPAALLELRSQYGVIRMQIGTAIPLFVCNLLLIYLLAF